MIQFSQVTTDSAKNEMYKLRYQVYCIEKKYLFDKDFPDRLEKDKWDQHSAHFIASYSGEIIGTARLIQNSPLGLPIEHLFGIKTPKNTKNSFTEFSRLIVNPKYRQLNSSIANGLYRSMLHYSQASGITHWYAVLEHRLHKMFKRYGFLFKQLGDPLECFGCINAPYILSLDETLEHLQIYNPRLYDYLTMSVDEFALKP